MSIFSDTVCIKIRDFGHDVVVEFKQPQYRESFKARAIRAKISQAFLASLGGKTIYELSAQERDVALAQAEASEADHGEAYVELLLSLVVSVRVDDRTEAIEDLKNSDFLARHVGRCVQEVFFRDELEDLGAAGGSGRSDTRRDNATGEGGEEVQGLHDDVPGSE